MPNAAARAATAWPMRPKPTMPSCLPRRSVPSMKSSANPFHAPRRTRRSPSTMPARDAEDERPRQVGRRLGQHVGRVGDDDAALARRRHVDVVVADGNVATTFEVAPRLEHRAIDGVGHHADQPLLAGHARDELVVREACSPSYAIDVARRFEPRARRRQLADGTSSSTWWQRAAVGRGRAAEDRRRERIGGTAAAHAHCRPSVSVRLAVAAVIAHAPPAR